MRVVTLALGILVAAATLSWIAYVLSWQQASGHLGSHLKSIVDVAVYSCLLLMIALWIFTPSPAFVAALAAASLLAQDIVMISHGSHGALPVSFVSSHMLNAMIAAALAWIAAKHLLLWRAT